MSERTSQLLGLTGFILAGFVFVAAGIRSGDVLTVAGSVLWIAACVIWLVPLTTGDGRRSRPTDIEDPSS